MCLDYIRREKPPKEGVGWKTFGRVTENHVSSAMRHDTYPRGVWVKAYTETRIEYFTQKGNTSTYRAGFHVWIENPGTPNLVKVRFRGGRILGQQYGTACVIADEIFVPKPRKKKK